MSSKPIDPLTSWSAPTAEMMKFWVSFWPIAPLFGVEWRFAPGFMPGLGIGAMTTGPMTTGPGRAEREETVLTAAERVAGVTADDMAVPETAAEVETEAESEPGTGSETPFDDTAPEAPAAAGNGALAARGEIEAAAPPSALMDAAPETPDDLQRIKGIGPALAGQLNELGIYRFEQIAGFTEMDLRWVDENLTSVRGRCFRDDWVGQAKALMG